VTRSAFRAGRRLICSVAQRVGETGLEVEELEQGRQEPLEEAPPLLGLVQGVQLQELVVKASDLLREDVERFDLLALDLPARSCLFLLGPFPRIRLRPTTKLGNGRTCFGEFDPSVLVPLDVGESLHARDVEHQFDRRPLVPILVRAKASDQLIGD
jgi:hypothetical protein